MYELSLSPFSGYTHHVQPVNPLNSFIDKLFSLPPQNIPEALESYAFDDCEDALISGIWNHPFCSHEAKVELIGQIAPHLPFAVSLISLFNSDPLTALFILTSLTDQELARSVLDTLLENNNGYNPLIQSWSLLASSFWEDSSMKSEPLELLLDLMTDDERDTLFDLLCAQEEPTHIAQLCPLLVTPSLAKEFATCWCGRFELDEDFEDKFSTLLHLIIAELPPLEYRPPILRAFLLFEGDNHDGDQVAYDCLDQFSKHDQSVILWCLAPTSLSDLIKDLSPDDDRSLLLGYLNQILLLPDSLENKISATRMFINRIQDEEVLTAWLAEMVFEGSPAAPYVWIAFSDELFSFIVTDPGSNSLRTQLLHCVTRRPVPFFQDYIRAIAGNPNRLQFLMSLCTMDIASQTQVHVADEMFVKWMSFNDVGEYLLDGVITGDLSEKMTNFKTDFQRVPPIFFAIGMTLPLQRQWIIPSAMYCTDEQLTAIALMMPDEVNFETLEHLISLIMHDQFKTVLNNLSPSILKKYIAWKNDRTMALLAQIRQCNLAIRSRIDKMITGQENSLEFYEAAESLCFEQSGRINLMNDPKLAFISSLCLQKAEESPDPIWKAIPQFIQSTGFYSNCLQGESGHFKRLQDLAPSLTDTLSIDLDALPAQHLSQIGASSWSDIGIKSGKDLEHLGLKGDNFDCLESYLSQENLKEVWLILKSKHLTDIDTLISGFIATQSELFDLQTFSHKL